MNDSLPIEPKHVGCPHCCAGSIPAWRHETQEYVHVLRRRLGDRAEQVMVTICQAFDKSQGK